MIVIRPATPLLAPASCSTPAPETNSDDDEIERAKKLAHLDRLREEVLEVRLGN